MMNYKRLKLGLRRWKRTNAIYLRGETSERYEGAARFLLITTPPAVTFLVLRVGINDSCFFVHQYIHHVDLITPSPIVCHESKPAQVKVKQGTTQGGNGTPKRQWHKTRLSFSPSHK